MLTFEKEILELIERDLPNQLGNKLKKMLEEIEQLSVFKEESEKELYNLSQEITIKGARIKEQALELTKYQDEAKKVQNLFEAIEKRTHDLDAKERGFENTIFRMEAEYAIKGKNDLFDLVKLVLKSPVYKETINTDSLAPVVRQPPYVGGSDYVEHQKLYESKTKKIETE